jgi:hypothetical protein
MSNEFTDQLAARQAVVAAGEVGRKAAEVLVVAAPQVLTEGDSQDLQAGLDVLHRYSADRDAISVRLQCLHLIGLAALRALGGRLTDGELALLADGRRAAS